VQRWEGGGGVKATQWDRSVEETESGLDGEGSCGIEKGGKGEEEVDWGMRR
jgi:hypothetical protein